MYTDNGTIKAAAFELPLSSFLNETSQEAYLRWAKWNEALGRGAPGHWTDPEIITSLRTYFDQRFFPETIARTLELYPVRIHGKDIDSVKVEVISPAQGVAPANRGRVLINLHGGGFTVGARYGGQLESIPVANLGGIEVISVDYRMAPEYEFPAATEDVVAVYRALLRDYPASNIGLFGCSAGGILTSQVTARLLADGLPVPGALGMFCGAGSYWGQGDSAYLGSVLEGEPIRALRDYPYYRHAALDDPLVFPACSDRIMAQFPPSLLIGATRDWVMSSVVHTHTRLTALGVEARLHMWEGLGHAFFYNPDLPQSREAHKVAVRFFDRYLGK